MNTDTKTSLHWIREQGWALGAVFVCLIALTIGWSAFAGRMIDRSQHDDNSTGDVARIWGGPLLQPQPSIEWRRADAATVELTRAEIAATKVDVVLDGQYRRRGITEFPGYEAKLSGKYRVQNPSKARIFVAFKIGLPVERSALMLSDLKLLIDGAEDSAHTEYASDRIVWTGEMAGDKSSEFTIEYRARGMQRFGYALASSTQNGGPASSGRPINNFEMAILVRGIAGEVDYPIGAMSPTAIQPVPGGRTLIWRVDRLLTAFDVGVVLPDRQGVTRSLQHLIKHAPFFYLLYAAGLLYAFAAISRRARALHVLGLSTAYFLYFPLASYLTAYVAWPIACVSALVGISALAIVHGLRFIGGRAAIRIATCQGLFLAVPATAYLVPQHTGLILVLSGFVALGVLLQALGVASRAIERRESEPKLRSPGPQISEQGATS